MNINDGIFVVVERNTDRVLISEPSPVIVKYLINSELDAYADYISIVGRPNKLNFLNITIDTHYSYNKHGGHIGQFLDQLLPNLITPEFLAKRKKMLFLQERLVTLRNICEREVTRAISYIDFGSDAYLISQLNKCDPLFNRYTNVVIEYAGINEIDESTAYQELLMLVESNGLIRLRNYAIFNKAATTMSLSKTKEEINTVIAQVEADVRIKRNTK